jgi:hypothetical protein
MGLNKQVENTPQLTVVSVQLYTMCHVQLLGTFLEQEEY